MMTFKERPEETMDNMGTGASRISWEHDAAHNLLLRIIEEYPDADHKTLARHLRERAPEEGCEFSIYLYFVQNRARALKGKRRKRTRGTAASARAAEIKRRLHRRL